MENTKSRNKIVVDYSGRQELILLTVRDNETDEEYLPVSIGFPTVEKIDMSLEQLMVEKKRPDFVNKEGFVLLFTNGFRVKIKYEEYFRLHKIMTGINPKFVWEFMKEGKEIPLEGVPDEFFQYVTNIKNELLEQFVKVNQSAWDAFEHIFIEGESRKDFAMKAMQSKYRSILFKMLEGKPYDSIIWDMIEPKFTKTQFSSLKKMEDDN